MHRDRGELMWIADQTASCPAQLGAVCAGPLHRCSLAVACEGRTHHRDNHCTSNGSCGGLGEGLLLVWCGDCNCVVLHVYVRVCALEYCACCMCCVLYVVCCMFWWVCVVVVCVCVYVCVAVYVLCALWVVDWCVVVGVYVRVCACCSVGMLYCQ